ncbi:Hypothetical protein CAP_0753 [Chondromyces apiculatus DSM 436]|uniref:Uncharacterized protein n=1 Tax=Chondromyces apiculatus DSM 436 TaxID=1192034 RepID=A0A017TDF5_9BACT|nr:Hypothetical protein CAP_0753 [Chondromyces apiculatus DSM 436]
MSPVHAVLGEDVQSGEANGPGSKRGAPPQREATWGASLCQGGLRRQSATDVVARGGQGRVKAAR